MKALNVARRIGRLLKKRERRLSVGARRGHVELRALAEDEIQAVADALDSLTRPLEGMSWVEVNAHTRRAVFAYEENAFSQDDLEDLVTKAEQIAGVGNATFDELHSHPADVERAMQLLLELGVDAVAVLVGTGLRFSPLPAVPFSGNAVAILSLLRGSQRVRAKVDGKLGHDRAELLFNALNAATQTMAHRPMSSLVDSVHKYSLLREAQAMRGVWLQREAELCERSTGGSIGLGQKQERPCPIPNGPIEEYSDRAWAVSLSGFGLSFLTTRSIQRAVAALFGGLPRPARIGREVYSAELGRLLSARGVMVLDQEALRKLDRIDCLVLQGDLVGGEQFVISGVMAEDPEEADPARTRANVMFDSEHPLDRKVDGLWVLQPWSLSRASIDIELEQRGRERLVEGALLLSLERAERVVAIIEVEIIARTGVEELIAAAQDAHMRVVISTSDDGVLDRLHVDDVIPDQEGLRAGIRRLQREGNCVALVATGNSDGLPVADIGIGLTRDTDPTPWGAALICHSSFDDVQFLIDASRRARRLSKQAVNIVLGAASFGALVSAGGLLRLTTRRVVFVVNMASLISMANGYRHSVGLQRLELPPPRDPTPWHALDARGVMARLDSKRTGLNLIEVGRRAPEPAVRFTALEEFGEAVSDELFNPLAPLLAAGAGLSAVAGSIADAGMVAGVVVVNALIGGGQRFRTERKIRSLAAIAPIRARVRRGGHEFIVEAGDLVRGDLVVLAAGDVVPADCRIIEAHSLEVDASSLTGESLPVAKHDTPSFETAIADRGSMLYEGTSIASGRSLAVVVTTGNATEARRGATSVKRGKARGGVEQRLRHLMDLTGPVALAAGIGVVGGGLLRGRKMEELVGSGVSLAVASVPEGLPLLATAAQLAAAQRLGTQGALVRNGRSIEALGRINVICLDKTGTLTEGRISLVSVSDGQTPASLDQLGEAQSYVLETALCASEMPDAVSEHDPTDEALHQAATKLSTSGQRRAAWQPSLELAFESGRSFHASFGPVSSGYLLAVKGAPEAVLPLCARWRRGNSTFALSDEHVVELAAEVSKLGRRGLRVLAVAERRQEQALQSLDTDDVCDLDFVGLLAFTDPVRATAVDAIVGLHRAGVRTLMLTGDHPSTAESIASELELLETREIMSGGQLADIDDAQLDEILPNIAVFARITPAQKVRIVRALQRSGNVVAMVGDGANDAPAIRLSDVGVAVGQQSTAAARAAADIILSDGRIETLVPAIAEGRAMWASVRDAVSILLGGNLGEIGFTTAVGLVSGRPPLSARQLLLVNLLTDVAPAMAIALRPPTKEALDDLALAGPEATLGEPLNREIAMRAALTAFGAGSAWAVARVTGSRARARTVGLAALVGTQLGQTIRSGEGSQTVWTTALGSAALLALMIQTPGVSHFFGCRPLGPIGWATAIGASAAATNLPALSRLLLERMTDEEQSVNVEQLDPERAAQLQLDAGN